MEQNEFYNMMLNKLEDISRGIGKQEQTFNADVQLQQRIQTTLDRLYGVNKEGLDPEQTKKLDSTIRSLQRMLEKGQQGELDVNMRNMNRVTKFGEVADDLESSADSVDTAMDTLGKLAGLAFLGELMGNIASRA